MSVAKKDHAGDRATTHKLVSCVDEADNFFNVLACGDALYELLATPHDYPTSVSLQRRDQQTGRPTVLVSLAETSPAQFVCNSYRFAVDNGTLYIVRRRHDGNTEVWKMTFSPHADAVPTRILDQNLGFAPCWLTVYDRQLMLAGTSDNVFRWDLGSDRQHRFQYTGRSAVRKTDVRKASDQAPQPFRFYGNLIDVCVEAMRV